MEIKNKIDIHAHAVAFEDLVPVHNITGERFLSADELLAMYDKLGIEKGVLLPLVSPEAQCFPITNEEVISLVKKHPNRFAWFCNIDPRAVENRADSDLSYLLEHYKSFGAKGLGELTANLYADDPMMENLLASCAEQNLPVLIHISTAVGYDYGIVDDLGLPRIEKMLKKYPDLKIIGHSQAFWSEITADNNDEIRGKNTKGKITKEGRVVSLMREYPNLYCDLSAGSGMNAMTRDSEFAAKFLTEFSDRIYYGCDICASYNTHSFILNEQLENLYNDGMISLETYRKVCFENAEKLLK